VKFLDEVIIDVRSGKGGDGMVHFHRERFVPRGGPDGGNGGDGGHVILQADEGLNTLLHLRFNPRHRAEHGQGGGTNNRTGRRGADVVIRVPVGTTARLQAGSEPIADLVTHGQTAVIAQGGQGGRGNTSFKSSTNRTPLEAAPGGPATQLRLQLELRLLADVGLVGLPNAGKSTLVARISAARPRVADYPFTTLEPSLGVVRYGDHGSFVVADLPGLIEGAHEGHGLGHRFLRHIERTAVFLHLVSVEPECEDALTRFEVVRNEIEAYDEQLRHRHSLLGLTKIDTVSDRDALDELAKSLAEATGLEVLPFSAVSGEGIEPLVHALGRAVETARRAE